MHHHPALRDSCFSASVVYDGSAVLDCKGTTKKTLIQNFGQVFLTNKGKIVLCLFSQMRGMPAAAHSLRISSGQMEAWISPTWAL